MIGRILDLFWPRACEVCGRPADRPGRYVCSDCLMRLPFLPTDGLCRTCGREAVKFKGEYRCEECLKCRPFFDRAVSALRFENEARELINSFKFGDALYLRADLVDFLEAAIRARFRVAEISSLVPMPLTRYGRWRRGYNQCEEVARLLARRLGKPCKRLLKRVGNPKRQSTLSEEERRKNVIDTFRARPAAGTVLIIDDIMTTGSTLSEAARMLKLEGAKTVWAATLARSIRY